MTKTAKVQRILNHGQAELAVPRTSACSHDCSSCQGCGMVEQPDVPVIAENTVGAVVGDFVTVETATAKVLSIAAFVYLIPFCLFFIGYLAAGQMGLGEGGAIGIGGISFGVGLVLDLLLNRMVKRRQKLAFRIVEIVKG